MEKVFPPSRATQGVPILHSISLQTVHGQSLQAEKVLTHLDAIDFLSCW